MDRRRYLKQFLIILGGNGAAQLVNLASYPLLTRIYSPHEFGIFAMFVAGSAVPAIIACGRFEYTITTARSVARHGALWLSLAIACVAGLVSAVGGLIYWNMVGQDGGLLIATCFGLTVALSGAGSALSMYLLRHDRFRARSAAILVRTFGAVAVQLGLGLISATAAFLILGFVAGLVAQTGVLAWVTWQKLKPQSPRLRDMRASFWRYRRQIAVDLPSSLIAGLAINLLTFILAALYDARIVGLYAVGNRLAMAPLQLINEALSQIFFQNAARARESKGHFWQEIKLGLMVSAALSVVVAGLLLLLARPFVTIFLGPQWVMSADMLTVLAPMLALSGVAMSIATTVFVLRRAHWLLIHNVATVATSFAAFAIGSEFGLTPIAFLAVASLLLAIEHAIFGALLVRAARP